MRYAPLLLFSLLLSTGQVLFKLAANAGRDRTIIGMLLSPWLLAALVLYGGATVLWVVILRTTPLSVAYPFAALGFVIVPVAAWWLFAEPLGWRYGLGTLMILGGILLTAR